MVRDADLIRQKLQKIREISTLPQVMHRIMEVVIDERSSSRDLAREISHDPPLTAKVLKVVNSAYYGFYRRISSVNDAVIILGYNEVRSIAITISVFDLFGGIPGNTFFDRLKLWEHCIATGTLADILRQEYQKGEEAAFVAGLLHDIGKVILDEYFSSEWMKVIEKSRQESRALVEVEQELLGITHADIGFLLSEIWNLPEKVGLAIRNHHLTRNQHPSNPLEAMVYIANLLVKEKGIGNSGDSHVWELTPEIQNVVGIKESDLSHLDALLAKRMTCIIAMLGYLDD